MEFAAVFGSRARGETRPDSDLDIMIRYSKPKSLLDFVGLGQELEEVLGFKVDLVTEGHLHPLVEPNVLKDLKVLYGERKRQTVR